MTYGLQKLGVLGGQAVPLAGMMGLAALIETLGGLLIMIGFFTRLLAFIASERWRPRTSWHTRRVGYGRCRTRTRPQDCFASRSCISRRVALVSGALTRPAAARPNAKARMYSGTIRRMKG